MSALLVRIADLAESGRVELTQAQSSMLERATINVSIVAHSLEGVLNTVPTWPPQHKWREIDAEETIKHHFDRTIGVIPYDLRPSTRDVAEWDPRFMKSLQATISRQKIRGKKTNTEVGSAHSLRDLFPVLGPRKLNPVRAKSPFTND